MRPWDEIRGGASSHGTILAANLLLRRPRSVLLDMTMQRLQMVTFECLMTVIGSPVMSGSATLPRAVHAVRLVWSLVRPERP